MTAIKDFVGKTAVEIVQASTPEESLTFYFDDRSVFQFKHLQDCCEHVYIEDINGDLASLIGSPLTLAEEITHSTDESDATQWTFYHFGTRRGVVTVRWNGSSNGYYSMGVDCCRLEDRAPGVQVLTPLVIQGMLDREEAYGSSPMEAWVLDAEGDHCYNSVRPGGDGSAFSPYPLRNMTVASGSTDALGRIVRRYSRLRPVS